MKIGLAVGIFSNINSGEFTEAEKAEAVYAVMTCDNWAKCVKRDATMEVVRWLWGLAFNKREDGAVKNG